MDKDEKQILEMLKTGQLDKQQALILLLQRQKRHLQNPSEDPVARTADRRDSLIAAEVQPPKPEPIKPDRPLNAPKREPIALINALQRDLARLISHQLKVDPTDLDAEVDLSEYGLDSISLGEFCSILNEQYRLDLTPGDLVEHSTLTGFAKFLSSEYEQELQEYFEEQLMLEKKMEASLPPKAAKGVVTGSASRQTFEATSSVPAFEVPLAKPEPIKPDRPLNAPKREPIALINALQRDLARLISHQLKVDPTDLDAEVDLSEYGLDSISLGEFCSILNEQYRLDLTPGDLVEHSTLTGFAKFLSSEYEQELQEHFKDRLAPETNLGAISTFEGFRGSVAQHADQEHPPQAESCSPPQAEIFEGTRPELPEILHTTTSPLPPHPLPESSPFLWPTSVTTESVPPRPASMPERVHSGVSSAEYPPIAIIGASGVFPKSPDLRAFWENLYAGRNLISETPRERIDWSDCQGDPQLEATPKWAGLIEGVDKFDAPFFNISPREAELMDPQQRLFLETVWHTIEDAGYQPSSLSGSRTGLFVGSASNDYLIQTIRHYNQIEPYSSTGLNHCVLANRISYILNLRGPSEPVDTACSSSLVAIHRAVKSIHDGDCEMAIVGGVSLILSPATFVAFWKAGMLAADGKCKAFDKRANGYVRGEGVGAIFLKPLPRAIAEGDHIYAVIRGSAVNHGGRTGSLTVPNPEAQAEVVLTAWERAGVDPAAISYIEAHGTGTKVGDPVEILGLKKALDAIYGKWGKRPDMRAQCGLGSVKTNIGHLEVAAGIAGIIKVLLAMHHHTLPASLNFQELNSSIDIRNSPLFIVSQSKEWEPAVDEQGNILPRCAGVNSFGFGGVNAHVLLEEYLPTNLKTETRSVGHPQIVVLSAKNKDRLRAYAEELKRYLDDSCGRLPTGSARAGLGDIAYTLQVGREAMAERLALIVVDRSELSAKLALFLKEIDSENIFRGSVKTHSHEPADLDRDKDGRERLETLIRTGELATLARLWVEGARVDWKLLHPLGAPCRVPFLPTYPFARKRYWLPEISPASVPGASVSTPSMPTTPAQLHPFIGSRDAAEKGAFRSTFTGNDPILRDHKVGDQSILPGVAYLEMARAAVELSNPRSRVTKLKNVVWLRPMPCANGELQVQIRLNPNKESVVYEISTEENSARVVHSQGRVYCGEGVDERGKTGNAESWLNLDDIRRRCLLTTQKKEIYEAFRSGGFNYGSSFQSIEELRTNGAEALARLRLPESVKDGFDQFVLHPSLMDGALQAISAFSLTHGPAETTLNLPFSLTELELLSPLTPECYAYAVPVEESTANKLIKKYHVSIHDQVGRTLVRMRNFVVRAIPEQSSQETSVKEQKPLSSALYYAPHWQEAEVSGKADIAEILRSGVVLIFDQNEEIYREFSGRVISTSDCQERVSLVKPGSSFKVLGPQIYQINPENGQDYEDLIEVLQSQNRIPSVILHLWNYHPSISTIAECKPPDYDRLLHSAFANGIQSVFLLSRVLAGLKDQKKFLYFYCGSESLPEPFNDAVSGFAKSLRQEHSKFVFKTVQLDEVSPGPPKITDLVLAELSEQSDVEICYQNARRGVRRFVDLKLQSSSTEQQTLKRHGVYLITGGFGGLGLIFARHLSHNYDSNLVLTGLSRLDAEKEQTLNEINSLGGEAVYLQADVASLEEMLEVVRKTKDRFGRLDGIIHAAGILADSLVINKDPASFMRVMAPKVRGTLNLDRATVGEALDFFVLFSSLSSVNGNAGQSDYASANRFMDSFAAWRETCGQKHRRFGRTLAINWPLWANGGMRPSAEVVDRMQRTSGLVPLDQEAGIRILEEVLCTRQQQIAVLYGDEDRLRKLARLAGSELDAAEASLTNPASQVTPATEADVSGIGATEPVLLPERGVRPLRAEVEAGRARDYLGVKKIAVIGMACRFPKSDSLERFWDNLKQGVNLVTEVPADRWRIEDYYSPDRTAQYKTYSKWGGYISSIDLFDAGFFRISDADAKSMDPQHRILLEMTQELLDRAGYRKKDVEKSRMGVFIGGGQINFLSLYNNSMTDEHLQHLIVNNSPNMMAARISDFYDLHGPACVFDTACSSALVAIHSACQSLRSGEMETAIAGGIELLMDPIIHIGFSKAGVLADDGISHVFDRKAKGFVLGEGGGLILLKPLQAAIRDGDQIHGVILGSAVNNDGHTMGLTTPNLQMQMDVIDQALHHAGVGAKSISYLEAHGTGTLLGDPVEIKAATQVYRKYSVANQYCAVGSVKSNMGHLLRAAGAASFIKVILALQHRQIPPTLHCEDPHPRFRFPDSPFYPVTGLQDWAPLNGVRRAGISSFGFGGTNCHLIVEEFKNPDNYSLTRRPLPLTQFHRNVYRLGVQTPILKSGPAGTDARVGHIEPGDERQQAPPAKAGAGRSLVSSKATQPQSLEHPLVPHSDLESQFLIEQIEAFLVSRVADILKVAPTEIDVEAAFLDLGLDSTTLIDLAKQVETAFDIELYPTLLFEYSTIRQISAYFAQTQPAAFSRLLLARSSKNGEMPSSVKSEDTLKGPGAARERIDGDELVRSPIPATTEVEIPVGQKEFVRAPVSARVRGIAARNDIAIIGASGVFPGSANLQQFWENLKSGRDLISTIPTDRWDWRAYFGDASTEAYKTTVKWGGFIEDVDKFDPLFFRISQREAMFMDPQQRIFLEAVWHTIEDAGYRASSLSGSKTGVFVGICSSDYAQLLHTHNIEAHSSIGLAHSLLPNRISYFLNFHGPSETVDTACSSSLIAIHRAVLAMQAGDCDLAIAGGVNLMLTPSLFIAFDKAGMLSHDGRCKTFDKNANGYVRSEGVAAILLKPLNRALADGDHLYAVIKGSAVNHGGRANSITAPNPSAQADLLASCYERAGVEPETISYIEAHGTGTALGDPVEIEGLKKAFAVGNSQNGKQFGLKNYCGLGTVKTNIGHLEAAAGIAGVIKVLLAMEHKALPASVHFKELNPYIELEDSPFYVVTETKDWERLRDQEGHLVPRRAGVSSFGFGGANAHIVLEEFERPAHPCAQSPSPELVVLSAKSEERLHDSAALLKKWVEGMLPGLDRQRVGCFLQNLAYTLQVGREPFKARLALVVSSVEELAAKLGGFLNREKIIDGHFTGIAPSRLQNSHPLNQGNKEGENLQELVRNKEHARLGELWTQGAEIDWTLLHPAGTRQRLSLPTYPFSRERYWIPQGQVSLPPRHAEAPTKALPSLAKGGLEGDSGLGLEPDSVQPAQPSLNPVPLRVVPHKERSFIPFLRNRIAELLATEPEKLDIDADLTELGFDSIIAMHLIKQIQETYAIQIYSREIVACPTINALASYLEAQVAVGSACLTPSYSVQSAVDVIDQKIQSKIERSGLPSNGTPRIASSKTELGGKIATPILFVLSTPRAGSTLLRVMLAGHSRLFCPPELHLLPFESLKERDKILTGSTKFLNEGLLRALMELKKLDASGARSLLEDLEQKKFSVAQTYEFLQSLLGDRYLVDKSPSYGNDLRTLRRAEDFFHEPRYLFLVRHPYAMMESFVRNRFDKLLGNGVENPWPLAEELWRTINGNIIEFLQSVPRSRWLKIRYEELVQTPEVVMRNVCSFFDFSYEESLLQPYASGRMTDGIHHVSLSIGDPNFLNHVQIDSRLADEWRKRLSDMPVLKPATLNLARKLGYYAEERVPLDVSSGILPLLDTNKSKEHRKEFKDAPPTENSILQPRAVRPLIDSVVPSLKGAEFKKQLDPLENSLVFCKPRWKREGGCDVGRSGTGAVLIFRHQNDFGLAAKLALAHSGQHVVTVYLGRKYDQLSDGQVAIEYSRQADFDRLLGQQEAIDAIYFLGGLQLQTDEITNLTTLNQTQELGVLSLFRLIKALGPVPSIAVKVITNDVYRVVQADTELYPYGSSLIGLSKVIAREYPQSSISCVDITRRAPDAMEAILRESALESAIRDNRRYVRVIDAIQLETKSVLPLRSRGVYLIIGGAGGIGLEVSRYLASHALARLVLVGRSVLDEKKQEEIRQIEAQGGEVLYCRADATDLKAMQNVVKTAKEKFGGVHGVIHSALVLADHPISGMDESNFKAALAPKVEGSFVLSEVIKKEPLDFILFFSSANSFIGNSGQSNYVAGCTFKDAYGLYLADTRTCPVKVINWGLWGEVGVVSNKFYRDRLARQGIYPLSREEGIAAFEQVLGSRTEQVMPIKMDRSLLETIGIGANYRLLNHKENYKSILGEVTGEIQEFAVHQSNVFSPSAAEARCLGDFCTLRLLKAFIQAGAFQQGGQTIGKVDCRNSLNIVPKYARLFDALLNILAKEEFVVLAGDSITVSKKVESQEILDKLGSLEQASQRLKTSVPDLEPHIDLLDHCAGHLMDILSGQMLATDLLFPNSSTHLVERIYKGNKRQDYFNSLAAEAVRRVVESRLRTLDAEDKVRILEVGAGIGGTTAFVLDAINEYADHLEYYYTDVSAAFTQYGSRTYGAKYSFTQFKVLDIEKGAERQSLEPASCDIIVAANVVHAARSLHKSIIHLKNLLKTNGLLILQEVTQVQPFLTLTFGLLDGWWSFEDGENRLGNAPLLGAQDWIRFLNEEGFKAQAFGEPYQTNPDDFGQSVVVAESDGLVEVTRTGLPYPEAEEAPKPPPRLLGAEVAEPAQRSELAPSQRQFFELFSDKPRWNIVHRIRLRTSDELNRDRFRQCWQRLFQRHPQLRTFFVQQESFYSQIGSADPGTFYIDWVDLGGMPPDLQEQRIQGILDEMNRAIDLKKWPLMHVTVAAREKNGYEILWVYHHLIGDGVSSSVMLGEILSSYDDPDLEIPFPLATYEDYLKDLRSPEMTGTLDEHLAYWQGQAFRPNVDYPIDFPSAGEARMDTERELVIRQPLSVKDKAPLFEILGVALYHALAEWTGCREPLITHRLHGRKTLHAFYHDVVGFFACDAPLSFPVNPEQISTEDISRFRRAFGKMPLGGITYSILTSQGKLEPSYRIAPVRFNYQPFVAGPAVESLKMIDQQVRTYQPGQHRRCYLIDMIVRVQPGKLLILARYSRAHHREDTIRALVERWVTTARRLTNHQDI